jgi:hypothetical protein
MSTPTLAEENKTIVRRAYEEAYSRGDLATAAQYYTDDYVRHDPATSVSLTWRRDCSVKSLGLTRMPARKISQERRVRFTSTARRLMAERPSKRKLRAKSALQTKSTKP